METSAKKLNSPLRYRYADILVVGIIVSIITAVVLTYRQVSFFGFILPGGIFTATISFSFLDIIAEVYGYAFCRRIIWLIIFSQIAVIIIIFTVLNLPQPQSWHGKDHFTAVLGAAPRAALANIISSFLGYFANAYVITKWKIFAKGKLFWFRSVCSSALGEGIYNSIWVAIAFGGILPYGILETLIISMWLYKLFFTAIINIPATVITKILKKKEGINYFDYETDFSVLKFSVEDPEAREFKNHQV